MYCFTVEFSVAISSSAPQVGGSELEFPAWMISFLCTVVPTSMSQLFCDAASVAGSQEPDAIGWPSDFQSAPVNTSLNGLDPS